MCLPGRAWRTTIPISKIQPDGKALEVSAVWRGPIRATSNSARRVHLDRTARRYRVHVYRKMSDIRFPPPVKLWVFVDEHPDSINDGWLVNCVNCFSGWTDLPGSYHAGACGFGFADGHGEIRKWQDKYNPATQKGTVQ